jgi:hypothetical protein
MDAGLVGALIGIGVMGCGALVVLCYEKGSELKRLWNQARVPVVKQRSPVHHFQMKELLQTN